MNKRALIVLVILLVILSFAFSIGHPWWYGPLMTFITIAIGLPIGLLLINWIRNG